MVRNNFKYKGLNGHLLPNSAGELGQVAEFHCLRGFSLTIYSKESSKVAPSISVKCSNDGWVALKGEEFSECRKGKETSYAFFHD